MDFVRFRSARFIIVPHFWHPLVLTFRCRSSSCAPSRLTFPFIPHPSTIFLSILTLVLCSSLCDYLHLDSMFSDGHSWITVDWIVYILGFGLTGNVSHLLLAVSSSLLRAIA